VSGRSQFPPLNRKATLEDAPAGCRQCAAVFTPEWPRSKWTMNGWSPWCPKCHEAHAPHKPQRRKSGPKPKGAVKGGWTNMPIN
jgi:thiol-disulfide isomerase/thioredoxin